MADRLIHTLFMLMRGGGAGRILHRFDPDTPIEETMMALGQAVRSGRALCVGISSYSAARTWGAARITRELGTPLLIHQPSYNMFNRQVEVGGFVDACESEGMVTAARI